MTYAKLPVELEEKASTLLESFSEELRGLIGNANRVFKTVNVRQAGTGPHLDVENDTCTVVVGPNAIRYEPTFVANIAHESVHLHLVESANRWASGLEEGFAVNFELAMVERRYGQKERQNYVNHLPKSYKTALADYAHLETIATNPVMLTREAYGRISGLTRRELRRIFPSIGWLMSCRLARSKQMRVG